jgi:hypothetical protein
LYYFSESDQGRLSEDEMILDVIRKIGEKGRSMIGNLKLREDNGEYMVYGVEIYVDEKGKKRKDIESCECDSECDRKSMEKEMDVSGWMYLRDSGAFVDEMYEEEEEDSD